MDDILNTGTINPLDFITTNNNLSLPQGNYGIFRQPQNPNSHYLFETDPTLIDTDLFLGSKYFMNRIGLDPDSIDLKFLGDSYFEYELIRKTIEQQSLLTNNTNLDPQEIKQQIDNLYNSMTQEKAQQLNLTIGEPLTEQQRSQLTEDTIWYVKQEITLPNGETYTALIPQIFYCNETLARLEQERILNELGDMIAGTNVILQAKGNNHSPLEGESTIASDSDARVGGGLFDDILTTLSNSGTITAKNTLVLNGFDEVNNFTVGIKEEIPDAPVVVFDENYADGITTIDKNTLVSKTSYKTEYKPIESNNNNYQATMSAGNTLIINTTENGTVNNLSGTIALNGNTNSTTLSQQETIDHKAKNSEFNKTSTYIGDIATIQSNNTNSNIIINAEKDINILGADIKAEQDNSNITLQAGNNINISTVQDYEYERQYTKTKGGAFGTTTTKEDIAQSLTNIKSNISAGSNLSITTGNDLTSIGTNFTASNGDIDLNIGNDLNLYNAMDYDYEYHYLKKEKFDLAGAIVSSIGAAATGVVVGAAFNAKNIGDMKTGSLDITENYDETIVKTSLNAGGNINLLSDNNATLTSVELNSGNDINILANNQILLNTAIERDYTNETHEKYESNLLGAFVGGAVTGAAATIGTTAGGIVGGAVAANYAADLTKGSTNDITITQKSTEDLINISSNINSNGDINILANNGDLISIGSDISANYGDILLQSNDGNVILSSAADTRKESSREYSKTFGNAFIEFDQQLSAGVKYNETEDKSNSTTITANTNNLEASNGNLTINSKESIISVGSQLYADKDINMNTDNGNILLTSANNSQTSNAQHDETTITVGVKIGNSYVDVGYAVDGVVKAGEAVKEAKEELKKMEKLHEEGKASSQAVEDAKANLAMASLNLANATLGVASAMASASASAEVGGFYASAFMNYDTTSTTSTEQSTWQTQGNIMSGNGNINFNTTNDMTQEGTNLYAANENGTGTINYNVGNNLTIEASKDTYSAKTSSENKSAGVEVGTSGFSVNAGFGSSSSRTSSTTYNNSEVIANNINITTGNDTTIKGANLEAVSTNDKNTDDNLSITTGNNLTIESLQDTLYSKSNSNSVNAGVGSGSASFGFNTEKGYTDSQWVNNQTSIIGDNSVNINVGTKENSEGKTTLTGAVIASGSYDNNGNFIDNNNLSLSTKELDYKDINDFHIEETKGGGFSTSLGTDPDKGKANIAPSGSTTISIKNTGSEKEQITRATTGAGNITIANKNIEDIKDSDGNNLYQNLNRDVNNSQEITKDLITDALDGSMTIDNRIFTEKGREDIVNDFKNFGGNLMQATENIIESIESGVEFTKEQYNNLKKYFSKQEEEMQVVVGYYNEILLSSPPNTPEYKEVEMKVGEAKKMMEMSSDV